MLGGVGWAIIGGIDEIEGIAAVSEYLSMSPAAYAALDEETEGAIYLSYIFGQALIIIGIIPVTIGIVTIINHRNFNTEKWNYEDNNQTFRYTTTTTN